MKTMDEDWMTSAENFPLHWIANGFGVAEKIG